MVSYRIHARYVPNADLQLNIGFAAFVGEMGLRASDMTPNVGTSAMLTNVILAGCEAALPSINILGEVGHGQQWPASGIGKARLSNSPAPRRDQHNDFSSLTTEFETGLISGLGLIESGGIALSCRPPS